MVVMTMGNQQPDIPGLFARRLARQFGGQPNQYEVYNANPQEDAPFMLITQNRTRLQEIVWNSPYTLWRGVQVGVIPWETDWNTVYDPPPFQAWIRLTGLPYNQWNFQGITKATTKLGTITGLLSYGREARHFRHITCRINCEDPQGISRFLKVHMGVKATRVRVDILHWRPRQDTPYPLQQNPIPPEQNLWGHPAPMPPPQPDNTSSEEELGGGDGGTDGSSGGSNMMDPPPQMQQAKKIKPWKIKLRITIKAFGKKKVNGKATQKATDEEQHKIRWEGNEKKPAIGQPRGKKTEENESLKLKRSQTTFQILGKPKDKLLVQISLTTLSQRCKKNLVGFKCEVPKKNDEGLEAQKVLQNLLAIGDAAVKWLEKGQWEKGCTSGKVPEHDKEIEEMEDSQGALQASDFPLISGLGWKDRHFF